MAGVKGRSGGARAGAGRKSPPVSYLPKSPDDPVESPPTAGESLQNLAQSHDDPEKFLLDVMNNAFADAGIRISAAKALLPYHCKKPAAGKREERADAAAKAATGKFGRQAPPKGAT
jgi:phage terminase small subunit